MSHAPSGSAADGDAPGWSRAMRTRSAPGRMRKVTGASSSAASPSIPAITLCPDSTVNSGAVHCSTECLPTTAIPSLPSSIRGRVPDPIGLPSRYRLFDTRIAGPDSCSLPSGPRKCRSSEPPSVPMVSGTVSRIVRIFASL